MTIHLSDNYVSVGPDTWINDRDMHAASRKILP